MAGALAARGEVRQSSSSRTGGRFPARVGSLGSTCAAHAHTRARAHARARPRCTLQNTFPQHCTSTTTALFCICTLTCASHSGAGGRDGLGLAWHRRSQPLVRRRESLRGLQPPPHDAAVRFTSASHSGGRSAVEVRRPDRAAGDGFLMHHWLQKASRCEQKKCRPTTVHVQQWFGCSSLLADLRPCSSVLISCN